MFNKGLLEISLSPAAPVTCKNFCDLVSEGYYDNVIFHRVIPGFIIQTGDPTGTGCGGQSSFGHYFEDEFSDLRHSDLGVVSMANIGPNTNASQFFITLASTPWLDGKNTIFGKITKGFNTLRRISEVATDAQDKPFQDVRILKAYNN